MLYRPLRDMIHVLENYVEMFCDNASFPWRYLQETSINVGTTGFAPTERRLARASRDVSFIYHVIKIFLEIYK